MESEARSLKNRKTRKSVTSETRRSVLSHSCEPQDLKVSSLNLNHGKGQEHFKKAGKKNVSSPMAAVILAAGMGTRMKSSLPKVLHRLLGKSLIRRSADLLMQLSLDRKIIVVSPSNEALIRREITSGFDFAVQEKPLGTAHAVLSSAPLLKDWQGDVLVLCADTPLLTLETIKKFIEKHREGHYYGTVLTGRVKDPSGYGRVVCKTSGEVSKIVEEVQATVVEKSLNEINSGTYCFNWPVLKSVLKEVKLQQEKNELYLTDVVEVMNAQGKAFGAFCVEDEREVMGINSRRQLSEAGKVLRERVLERLMDSGVTIVDPASTFVDETVVIGEDTILHPFTVIEGEVVIGKHCEIGPFAHIRGGTTLKDRVEIGNFVEVKASQLDEHVKAKHLTYLGDALIGRDVNIGAGTITANYDGKKKHKTLIEEKAFIGSGTILVAPVSVGKEAVTGAGAVVTRGKNVPANAVVVGVPAKLLNKANKESQ